MKTTLHILSLLFLVSPLSCNDRNRQNAFQEGRVFVATKGGQNIELGSVPVGAITHSMITGSRERLHHMLQHFESWHITEKKRTTFLGQLKNDYEEWETRLKDLLGPDRSTSHLSDLTKAMEETVQQLYKAEQEEVTVDAVYNHLETHLAENLTLTDSDGSFQVKRNPEQPCVIAFARGQRPSLDEEYYWFIRNPTKSGQKLMFTNHNMYGGDAIELLAQLKMVFEWDGAPGETDQIGFKWKMLRSNFRNVAGNIENELLGLKEKEQVEAEKAKLEWLREQDRLEAERQSAIELAAHRKAVLTNREEDTNKQLAAVRLNDRAKTLLQKVTIRGFSGEGVVVYHSTGAETISWAKVPPLWKERYYLLQEAVEHEVGEKGHTQAIAGIRAKGFYVTLTYGATNRDGSGVKGTSAGAYFIFNMMSAKRGKTERLFVYPTERTTTRGETVVALNPADALMLRSYQAK